MHVILNGVNSRTIQGLEITSLPPVSAPPKRTNQILIDGRDGDILEDLGYSAYEKAFTILLHNNYDPNEVIGFFSQSGTAIFSNEPDMVYTYEMVNGIDISKGNFNSVKVATITFHVQPYKLSATEQPATGEVSTLVDKTPYIIRRTPFGTRQKGTIVGGSIVFNQIINDNAVVANGGTKTWDATNKEYTITATNLSSTYFGYYSSANVAPGHVVFASEYLNPSVTLSSVRFGVSSTPIRAIVLSAGAYTNITTVVRNETTSNKSIINYHDLSALGLSELTLKVKNLFAIDLTLMFGPTIADYIYTQEQTSAGAGVSLAKAWAGITADYYPYDAGSIKSVEDLTAHRMTGKNLLKPLSYSDGINIGAYRVFRVPLPKDTRLCMSFKDKDTSVDMPSTVSVGFVSSNYTSGALSADQYRWIMSRGVVQDNKTNVPISGDDSIFLNAVLFYPRTQEVFDAIMARYDIQIEYGSTATEYEAYTAYEYPLDSSLTLRGLPKLDGDSIYYDGDIYKADGTVERRYGVRAYQSGDESDANVLTDGTNTVYKLTTPTTEQAEPYTALQTCDPAGTEEWVGASMPVGHETTYIDPISMTVTNEGNTTSAPSITIEGEGAVEVTVDGLNILQIQMPASGEITIDSRTLDATDGEGGLANRSVTGDYNDLQLAPGEHTVTVTGDVTSVTLKNTSRWI